MAKSKAQTGPSPRVKTVIALTLALFGQIVAAVGVTIGVLFPEVFKSVLGPDSRSADQVLFALLVGVLVSGIGLARWFAEVRGDIDGIEKNLKEANEDTHIWVKLQHTPTKAKVHDAVETLVGIDYSTILQRATWWSVANEELGKAADELKKRGIDAQSGVVKVPKEDWNYLLRLVEDWDGVMRATSVNRIDGSDFWRAGPRRDTYLKTQYQALKNKNLRSIQRAYIISAADKATLMNNSAIQREFVETVVLNELIGVDVRFVEADDIGDFILFESDKKKKKSRNVEPVLYFYSETNPKDGCTTITCNPLDVKAHIDLYSEIWGRAQKADAFYASAGIAQLVAEVRSNANLDSIVNDDA